VLVAVAQVPIDPVPSAAFLGRLRRRSVARGLPELAADWCAAGRPLRINTGMVRVAPAREAGPPRVGEPAGAMAW